jgi:hypothetical protein
VFQKANTILHLWQVRARGVDAGPVEWEPVRHHSPQCAPREPGARSRSSRSPAAARLCQLFRTAGEAPAPTTAGFKEVLRGFHCCDMLLYDPVQPSFIRCRSGKCALDWKERPVEVSIFGFTRNVCKYCRRSICFGGALLPF